MRKHGVDPEPITIYLAAVASITCTVTIARTVEDHLPKIRQTKIREKVLKQLTLLEGECRNLRVDIVTLGDLFRNAEYPHGRSIELISGARLSGADFVRYERTAENVYDRLRHLNHLCNDVEKLLARFDGDLAATTTNPLGDIYAQLDSLLKKHKLSVDEGWQSLEDIARKVEGVVGKLRSRLAA